MGGVTCSPLYSEHCFVMKELMETCTIPSYPMKSYTFYKRCIRRQTLEQEGKMIGGGEEGQRRIYNSLQGEGTSKKNS